MKRRTMMQMTMVEFPPLMQKTSSLFMIDNVVINITCHEISWVIDSVVSIHTIL